MNVLKAHFYLNCVQIFTLCFHLNTAPVRYKDERLYVV